MGETLDIVPLGGICFGAADDVEQLGHAARAQLVKRRLPPKGSGVLQLESLGLVGGQAVW